MATKNIEYFNSCKLPCAGCSQVDVILCIPAAKVANPACPTGMTSSNSNNETFEKGFIYATLIAPVAQWFDACGNSTFKYVFSYDDVQIEPGQELFASDITGVVCDQCFADWVRDIVGLDVIVEELTPGFITITNQHGCQFTFEKGWTTVVQDPDNADVTFTYPDGNTTVISVIGCSEVPACETPITANDSDSIDLTASGTSLHTLVADLNVDVSVLNMITVSVAGVLVSLVSGNGLVGAGNAATPLNLVVDPNGDNITTVGALGILTLETNLTVTGGSGITAAAGGTHGHALTVTARVDAAAGNDATMVVGATGGTRVEVGVGAKTGVPSNPTETIAINAVGTFTGTSSGLASITNNHLTRNMVITSDLERGASGSWTAAMVYDFHLEMDDDAAGFVTYGVMTSIIPVEMPAGSELYGSRTLTDNDKVLAAGATYTRKSRIKIVVTALPTNTGTWEKSLNTIRMTGMALKGL